MLYIILVSDRYVNNCIILSQKLLETASEQQRADLKSGVNMIVNEMGQRFKFMSIFPKKNRDLFSDNPPAGFM